MNRLVKSIIITSRVGEIKILSALIQFSRFLFLDFDIEKADDLLKCSWYFGWRGRKK
jgi:hypothetical protein